MTMMRRYLWVVLLSLALVSVGCRSGFGGRSDSQIAGDVQGKINSDSNVPDKQITINSNNGTVTLSGNVSSDMARNAAANDAGQVSGVKTVINNLQVTPAAAANTAPPQPQQEVTPAAPAEQNMPATTTHTHNRPRRPRPGTSSSGGDNGLRTTVPPTTTTTASNNTSSNSSYDSTQNSAPAVPSAPTKITVPAGTQISIRTSEEVSSEKAQVGDIFHGAISSPITIDDQTVIPNTADVEGRVVEVKSAGRFAGQSVLTLELTKLMLNGKTYNIQTDRWTKSGNGRGKSTAAKVGGGAAVGAVLGGIFGGGKGAAIGAAAGAGAGTGVSAATKGQQIDLKPESVLNFQLQNSISVTH
ncbi:MAG: transporter [Candidatus Angelobacter sp. Gp1-AA117]|nr:MAG: transporter [Candidatus Angelobacter sp. Gp1-AA117]